MKMSLLLPEQILLSQDVVKITAEGENGSFCLLSNHIDFVSALAPSIFSYVAADGKEEFIALDGGILVKCGNEVLISTRQGIRGPELGTLKQTIESKYKVLDDRERQARTAIAKLEAGLVRRFMELESHGQY